MRCDKCGNSLVEGVGPNAIKTLRGETMVFRRTTDYVMCNSCNTLYSITQIRDSAPEIRMDLDRAATTIPLFT